MLEGPRKETFPPGLRARGKVWSHLKLWIFHGKSLYFYIITKLYIDIKTTILQDWRELACFLEGDPISVKLWPLHHL